MKEENFITDMSNETRKFSFRDFKGHLVNTFRSSIIGTFVGILPGVGGSAASLLSYSQAKNFSRTPEKYGTGYEGGIIASEAANNGLTGGALIPLLSFGIPGDATTAVLIGAFMLQGVQVGPLFITNNVELWHTILFALLLANIFMFLFMFYPIKYVAKIIQFPKQRLYPVIILLCVVGSYASNNGNIFDLWVTLAFGIIGFIFTKLKLPMVPFLIGFILGGDLEKYFIDTIKGSGGSLSAFFIRPMSWILWLLIAMSVVWAIYDNSRIKKNIA
jgi:putative tricarboxylic transport membrane protein